MRLWQVFLKTWCEMRRDWIILSLTLAFAPFFVFLYWLFTYGGSTSYQILVLNNDHGFEQSDGTTWIAGEKIREAINSITYPDGKPLLKAIIVDSFEYIETRLQNRNASAYLIIPEDFSKTITTLREGDRSVHTKIIFGGDLTNPYYMIAANLAITAIDTFVQRETAQKMFIEYIEEPLGTSGARTEFENYVPGMLIFAVILLIFLASMTVAKEIEAGTLLRLKITPMTSFDFLGGITIALVLIGIIAILLSFLTAILLGFHSQGPLWVAIVIGAITSLSIIGTGLIVACFSNSVSQAFVIANFPLGLYMFFSGAIFPIPKVEIFTIGERAIGLYDILPPTHAVIALNKVLTLGAGFYEIQYELTALLLLSFIYFGIGVGLFQHNHLSK
jgi:ABC-2 type transport system permease protein